MEAAAASKSPRLAAPSCLKSSSPSVPASGCLKSSVAHSRAFSVAARHARPGLKHNCKGVAGLGFRLDGCSLAGRARSFPRGGHSLANQLLCDMLSMLGITSSDGAHPSTRRLHHMVHLFHPRMTGTPSTRLLLRRAQFLAMLALNLRQPCRGQNDATSWMAESGRVVAQVDFSVATSSLHGSLQLFRQTPRDLRLREREDRQNVSFAGKCKGCVYTSGEPWLSASDQK